VVLIPVTPAAVPVPPLLLAPPAADLLAAPEAEGQQEGLKDAAPGLPAAAAAAAIASSRFRVFARRRPTADHHRTIQAGQQTGRQTDSQVDSLAGAAQCAESPL
jgi:hypothetical protein